MAGSGNPGSSRPGSAYTAMQLGKRKAADDKKEDLAGDAAGLLRPKRPPTAFSLFSTDFRKKNPHKGYFAAGRAAVEWRTMTASAKAPYLDMEEKMMLEYNETYSLYKSMQPQQVTTQEEDEEAAENAIDEENKGDTQKKSKKVRPGKEKVCDEVDGAGAKLVKPKAPRVPDETPGSSFYYFLVDFKEINAKKYRLLEVGHQAAMTWNAMTDDEKAVFVAIADKKKEEYAKYEIEKEAHGKKMEDYTKKVEQLPRRRSSRNK